MCQSTSICERRPVLSVVSLAILMAALAGCRSLAADRSALRDNAIAITHVTVLMPSGESLATDMMVLIRGRRIAAITRGTQAVPERASVIDGHGKVLIPGLWDMHVHILTEGTWALREYVAHGITGVRDMGGRFETLDSLRRAITAGTLAGPRIIAVGPMIENADAMTFISSGAAGAGAAARAPYERLLVTNPVAATKAVDSLARLGVDMIKGRDFANAATYWGIANAARRAKLMFVGHPPDGLGLDPLAVADSGQRSVEHWYFPGDLPSLPHGDYERIVSAYRRNGTALTPTMAAWRQHRFTFDSLTTLLDGVARDPRAFQAQSLMEHWRTELALRRTDTDGKPATVQQLMGWNRVLDAYAANVGKLRAEGMVILAGSDLPFAHYPGDALHLELSLLVREGNFTPAQALASATSVPARFLGIQDSVGSIAVGKIADLVLLDANPLGNIDNVRKVSAVLQGGRITWTRGGVDNSPPRLLARRLRRGAP